MSDDDQPTKVCPDCAETVLAAARKCRFCGYRFDTRKPAPKPGATNPLLSMIRRETPTASTVPELLDSWNIRLDPDEDEDKAALCHGSIDGLHGYVVVTNTRFRFVPAARGVAAQPVRDEHLLSDLLRVHTGRRRLRRVVFLEWRDTRTVVEVDAAQLQRLQDLLAPHALQVGEQGSPRRS